MEKTIVSEVTVQLGKQNDGKAFGKLLSNQFEECGFGGNKDTEKFDTINPFGSDKDGVYHINFLGTGTDFNLFEAAVNNFMIEFLEDLNKEENQDDFSMVLSEEEEDLEMPTVKGFNILITRTYQN